jgi:hypothetical protein
VLVCPFCGAPATDRFDLDGRRFLVFQCMFTPEVDPTLSEEEVAQHLREEYREGAGAGHFRKMCDRLHLYVTKGPGGQALAAPRTASSNPPSSDGSSEPG